MNENRTSKERLARLRIEWNADYVEGRVIHELADEIERLQRDVDQLAGEAQAMRNRIDDDTQTINRLVASRAPAEPSECQRCQQLTEQILSITEETTKTKLNNDSLRASLRRLESQRASEPPSDLYGRREPPHGYAYRYHDYRGDVLRFNNGEEVNGSKPFEVVPYWIGASVTKSGGREELNGESPRAGASVGQPSRPIPDETDERRCKHGKPMYDGYECLKCWHETPESEGGSHG